MSSNTSLNKATKISLFNFSSSAMRAFHMSWLAFFVCFFAWFACAPLMPVIAGEFSLTTDSGLVSITGSKRRYSACARL